MGNAPGALHQRQHAQSSHRQDDGEDSFVLSSAPIPIASASAQVYGAYGLPVDSVSADRSPAQSPPAPPMSMSLIDEEFEEAYASGKPLYRGEIERHMSPHAQSSLSASPPPQPPHSPPPALPLPLPSPSPSPSLQQPGALASVPLEVQLQFLRLLCTHLDFRSLLAVGRVNTLWRAALAPEQQEQSPLSPSASLSSPAASLPDAMLSPVGSSEAAPVEAAPRVSPAPTARDAEDKESEEEEEEEPRRHASAQPPSYAALHMNPFASPLGWGAFPPLQTTGAKTTTTGTTIVDGAVLSPADSAGDSSPDSRTAPAAATATTGLESDSDDNSESDGDDGDDGIRFHMEAPPMPRGFGSHLSRQASQSPSPWHGSLELRLPAREGWLKYAARSGCLRSAQRIALCVDAERIGCTGAANGVGPSVGPVGAAHSSSPSPFPSPSRTLSPEESLQLSLMNSPLYSSAPHHLLPHLRSFPFLRALRVSLPVERSFQGDGRARLREAFEGVALTLRELHWEVLPEQAGDAQVAAPTTLRQPPSGPTRAATAPVAPVDPASLLVSPTRPSGPPTAAERATAQWSEQDRTQAFCNALVDSLPLLSLTSLSLAHFTLPDSADLSPLRLLPLLHTLHLRDLAVTQPRLLTVRGLATLRHLSWQGWSDEHAVLFAKEPPPALSSFGMAYASFGLLGLRALARSALATCLVSLRLDECAEVGDECCGLIASQFRSIRFLALRLDSPVAGFTGAALCSLASLPRLQSLELVGAGIPLRHCLPQLCSTLRASMDSDESDEGGDEGQGGSCGGSGQDGLDGCDSGGGSDGSTRGLRTLILEQVQLVPSAMELASVALAAASDNPDSPVPRAFSAASASSSSHSSSSFKHLTQLRSLTSLAVRRCAGTNHLLTYVSLLPQLRRLELERRRTPPAPVAKPASPPAAALLGATSCTMAQGNKTEAGGRNTNNKHSWSSATAQSQSQLQAKKGPVAAAAPSSPFGSLLLLSSLPRLDHLSCNFAQPRGPPSAPVPPASQGQGQDIAHAQCGDGVLEQLHQLHDAFLARGRRVYCEWRGQHVPAPLDNNEKQRRRAANHEDDGLAFV